MSGYEYVQMNYLLCGTQDAEDEEVSEITTLTNSPLVLTISNEKLGSDVVVNVTNVPLQRNYRTNIFGSLITAPYDYTVELSSSFSDDASATASKGEENYIVYTADDLSTALEQTPASITLMDSIEYSSTITISGTTLIDLNGYTLSVGSGTSDNEDGTTSIAVSGNAYIKNGTLRLTKGITVGDTGTPLFVLDGVTVESDEADGSSSAITASGNLLFINGTTAEAGVTLSSGFLVYTTDCTVGEETSGTTTQYVDATLTWATGLTYTNSTTSSSASSVTSVVTEGFTTTTGGTTLKTITVTDGIPISAAID